MSSLAYSSYPIVSTKCGPPPILSITQCKILDKLNHIQKKKLLLMKKKLRLQQEAVFAMQRKNATILTDQKKKEEPYANNSKDSISSASTVESSNNNNNNSSTSTSNSTTVNSTRGNTQQTEVETNLYINRPLTGYEMSWLDEICFYRYLVSRDFNVTQAFEMLMETVNFRRDIKPERIKPDDIKNLSKAGQIYRRGFDKHKNPIIYIRASLIDPTLEASKMINLIVYTIERAIQSIDKNYTLTNNSNNTNLIKSNTKSNTEISTSTSINNTTSNLEKQTVVDNTDENEFLQIGGKLTFIMDYNNYINSQQPPLNVSLKFLHIFQSYYPERLAHAFILDTPWYFQTFWKLISPFLPSRTANKIKFLQSDNPSHRDELFKVVPLCYVEDWIKGGKCNEKYDHEVYWENENIQFESYMKFLQKQFVSSKTKCKTEMQQTHKENLLNIQPEKGLYEKKGETKIVEEREYKNAQGVIRETEEGMKEETEEVVKQKKDVDEEIDLIEEEEEKKNVENEDEKKRKALKDALLKADGAFCFLHENICEGNK